MAAAGKKTESYPESTEVLAVFEEGLSPVQLRQLATMLMKRKRKDRRVFRK